MESEMDVKLYPSETSSSLSAGADEEKEKAEEKNNPSVMEEVENETEPVKPDPSSDIPSSSARTDEKKEEEETEEEKEKQSNEMEPVRPDPSSDIPSSSSARADEKRKGKMEEKEDKGEKKRKRKEKKQDKKKKKRTSSLSLPTTKANREVRKTISIHSPIVTTVDASIIVRQIKKITTTITLPPPPPEPEMHKHQNPRSLYLCIASHDQNISSQWYKINPYTKLNPNPQITTLHAFCSMPTPSPRNFQPVSGGGLRVYTFGGVCGSHESPAPAPSFVCDLTTQNPVWQLLHPMQSSKLTPAAALSPFDNRIYVFGSSSLDPKPCPWGEVYDPSSDSWETFLSSAPPPHPPPKPTSSTSPPHHTCRISHSLFLPNRQELLVFSYDHSYYWIHAFNFTTKTWKSVIRHNNKNFHWATSAAVGDFLYLNYDSYLLYIDLTQPKASLQPVYAFRHLAKKHMYLGTGNRYLSYLGNGKLCMLSASPSHKPGWTSIKCFKFWVGMSQNTKIAKATAVFGSSDEYIAQGDYIESCLTI